MKYIWPGTECGHSYDPHTVIFLKSVQYTLGISKCSCWVRIDPEPSSSALAELLTLAYPIVGHFFISDNDLM